LLSGLEGEIRATSKKMSKAQCFLKHAKPFLSRDNSLIGYCGTPIFGAVAQFGVLLVPLISLSCKSFRDEQLELLQTVALMPLVHDLWLEVHYQTQ